MFIETLIPSLTRRLRVVVILFLGFVSNASEAPLARAKETPFESNQTKQNDTAPQDSAEATEVPTAEDYADLLDQLMPYLTPQEFKAENQDEIARILTEAQKRGADIGLIFGYAGQRLAKTKAEYRLSGAYNTQVLDLALVKERQRTRDDIRKTTPVSDKRLIFKLSEKDKTVTSKGVANPLDIPTAEDCAELLDRLMVYMTPKKFTARNQDKIAEIFNEALEGGVLFSVMFMYLEKRQAKTEYGTDRFYNGHTLEITLFKRRTPTNDDRRQAVPASKKRLIFAVSQGATETLKSDGTRKVEAVFYQPIPSTR